MIHFLDFSNEKMVAKVPDIAPTVDILLGNLEDAVPVDRKEAARAGLIRVGREIDLGETAAVDAGQRARVAVGARRPHRRSSARSATSSSVIMVPKVEGPWDIHYVDRLLAQLEAQGAASSARSSSTRSSRPRSASTNLEEIAAASPRMQGMSFGPADLAASRRMKTTRVGGGHPGYRVDRRPRPGRPRGAARRAPSRTRGTTRSRAWSTPAPPSAILPFYGPFGDIKDVVGCEAQFRAAFLLGCVGAWSLHPVQIDIAKKVFCPDPDEVAFAQQGHRGDPRRRAACT